MNLIDAMVRAQPVAPVALRTGTVSAVTAPTLTVDLAGASLPGLPRLASYTGPAAGDVVLLLQAGAQLLVLGPVATT